MSSSKPLYFGALLALSLPAMGAEDLRTLEVQRLRGQSQEQTRRDRYECHNWAVEQTGGEAVLAAVLAFEFRQGLGQRGLPRLALVKQVEIPIAEKRVGGGGIKGRIAEEVAAGLEGGPPGQPFARVVTDVAPDNPELDGQRECQKRGAAVQQS